MNAWFLQGKIGEGLPNHRVKGCPEVDVEDGRRDCVGCDPCLLALYHVVRNIDPDSLPATALEMVSLLLPNCHQMLPDKLVIKFGRIVGHEDASICGW